MDDIQKRADDKAWDEKQDRWISDANRRIEDGLSGEGLAALHGLHVSPDDEPPYDVDEMSDVDNEKTLRDKIVRRLIQIGDTFSGNRDLSDDCEANVDSDVAGVLPERREERHPVARSETRD